MKVVALALFLMATSCGVFARPGPTVAPLISAAFLSVHLVTGTASDAQERSRLPALRDTIAGALPSAWASATGGRGTLTLRTDADIEVVLDGSAGTSALTEHTRDGKIVSRTIAVHTLEGNRHLSVPEIMATTLHELGHIWCCFGAGTVDGHWSDAPTEFSRVGLMVSPIRCLVTVGTEPQCPSVFSDRELKEIGLSAR